MSEPASSPMNFNESQHGSILLERLRQQRETGRFCDITLYVGDRAFRAHRTVLASCSAYFASVFQTRRAVRERLTVTCRDPEAFSVLINYMYTGAVALDRANVGEILRLANHFIVPRLKGHCGEYLDRHLGLANCLSALELAERCALPALAKAASTFVQLHLAKVVHGEEILALPAAKLHAFLANKTWQLPPAQALSLAARWVSRDLAGRQREMRRLLSSVDWPALGQAAACEHVDREPLYSASEFCLLAALRALADHGLLYPKYQPVYQALQDKMAATGFPSDTYLGASTSALSEEEFQLKSETSEKCEALRDSRVFRRRKRKLALSRPGARLAALRAALTLRQRRRAAENVTGDATAIAEAVAEWKAKKEAALLETPAADKTEEAEEDIYFVAEEAEVEETPRFIAHVPVPSQRSVEAALLARKKRELLERFAPPDAAKRAKLRDQYASKEMDTAEAEARDLLGKTPPTS